MLNKVRNLFSKFFNNTSTLNREPLNKASLIVIIIIDVFILINVFTGLDSIGRWHLTPDETYPCHNEWKGYQEQTSATKDYEIITNSLVENNQPNFNAKYKQQEQGRLGKVSEICLNYGLLKDNLNTVQNRQFLQTINQTQEKINGLGGENAKIRRQYDSTLLEKIARQPDSKSINQVEADKARQKLDSNTRQIAQFKEENKKRKNQLLNRPASGKFLSFLQDKIQFSNLVNGYKTASFWYPSIQVTLQAIFLLPLIFIASFIYGRSQRQGYGLVSLISWHLLVIFVIPLVIKVLEFLQVGVVFKFLVDIISSLLGGLLFLVSYVYIVVIPLVGFGIIKLLQRNVVFNSKIQAGKRVQNSQCINCGRNLRSREAHCPHCGYYQYVECHHCHNLTYKKLPYCYHCGTEQISL
ncbi:zinc ribbon domain-containing protein [Cylindrospermopsis raciborskii]|uniref:zinc ribbon domain-containing protein n=1 Tax=Cylindrospermopsis raciborskii TaxID=77022 RepID=UPI001142A4E9|nr:zinc ribbon domain-containing protein [Cylindrospermopsis raciborskii]TPX27158.1 zinc ribbon domain-containing protein [Cylindrospermopsis raciborskii GIHE 2018]UJS06154.1 zinc ribbon domain-containing protein [Cylindrospermopsis raciborskii KLL07]